MSVEPCAQWRGGIALLALDSLDERERTSVLAHVDGCEHCAGSLHELRGVTAALRHLDQSSLGPTAAVPATLASTVLGELRASATRARRRRHLAITSIAAGLALVASLVTWSTLSSPPRSATRSIALHGADGARATAVLVAKPWGTAITLTEHGLTSDRNYVVSLRSAAGSWWSAGTYWANARGAVTTQLSCAVPMRDVAGIEVDSVGGHKVLAGGSLGTSSWSGDAAG